MFEPRFRKRKNSAENDTETIVIASDRRERSNLFEISIKIERRQGHFQRRSHGSFARTCAFAHSNFEFTLQTTNNTNDTNVISIKSIREIRGQGLFGTDSILFFPNPGLKKIICRGAKYCTSTCFKCFVISNRFFKLGFKIS